MPRPSGSTDLVDRLPEGLDTPVHERGVSLSAGERQLLSLTRAFLARPRVLILDEATSNIDPRGRGQGGGGARRRCSRAAPRWSSPTGWPPPARADRIAVVDRPAGDGPGGEPAGARVVELGTHDELVALGGRYAEMYATWERHLHDDVERTPAR